MRYKNALCLAASVVFAVLVCNTALAEGRALSCLMTGEDVGNGYEYTVPDIGTFSVNCTEGETVPLAVFDVADGCFPVLLQNGVETEFDGMVIDSGTYELRLYGTEDRDGDYGTFTFTVKNEFDGSLTDEVQEVTSVTEVSDPELELTYDPAAGLFHYVLPDGEYIDTNIPIGGWYRSQARITVSDRINIYQTYLDGEILGFTQNLDFNTAGSYEIILRDNELGSRGNTSYRVSLMFTLYTDDVMNISHITTPMGLSLVSAVKDGQPVTLISSEYFHMEQDGRYRLEYADSTGRICWTMEFTRDTKPPYLRFNVPMDGSVINRDISFSPSEVTAQIRIERNMAQVEASLNQIRVNGNYHMEISDAAGNVRDYDFTLFQGKQIWTKGMIIIPIVLLAAVGAMFVYWRRSMRVL